MRRIVLAVIALGLSSTAVAHGGGLNAQGCHNDRKRGGYHCHRGSSGIRALPRKAKTFSGQARGFLARATGGAYYPNCSAARAAGAAPIREGQDGYSRRLDRDGDGVACE